MATSQQMAPESLIATLPGNQSLADQREQVEPCLHGIRRPSTVDERSRIVWEYVLGVGLFHLLIPLAFVPGLFSWWGVLWLPVGNYLFCSMGVGAGLHRLLTHRSYKCPLWFEHVLVA